MDLLIQLTYPACMFLFLLLSPARLLGTRTKSESGSVVSGLDPGDCLLEAGLEATWAGLVAAAASLGVSLVSILSLASGLTRPWVTAGEGGNIGGSGPGADTGTATVRVCSWPSCCWCCPGCWRKGWLKNASKSILSLASRLRR